jgi:hypothetical protein
VDFCDILLKKCNIFAQYFTTLFFTYMGKFSTEIKWGVIFTLMSVLWLTLKKLAGLHDQHIAYHPIFTNFIAIPAIAIYVFALREKRAKDYKGSMTYMQGFISGVLVTLVVTVLVPLYMWFVFAYITPTFFANAIKLSVELKYFTQTQAEEYFNLKNYLIQGLTGAPIMGIITTAIVAIFVKNK